VRVATINDKHFLGGYAGNRLRDTPGSSISLAVAVVRPLFYGAVNDQISESSENIGAEINSAIRES